MISMGAASGTAGRARGLSRPAVSVLGGLSAQKNYLNDAGRGFLVGARRHPTNDKQAVNGFLPVPHDCGYFSCRNSPQPPHYFVGKTAYTSHMSVQRFLPDLYDITGGGPGKLRSDSPPFSFKTEVA